MSDRLVGVTRPRRPLVRLLGPAFVAAVAYVDPGNVAANVTAGARFGFLLLWVLVVANLMAAVVQYLSAKLGLVTGRSLPGLLGSRLRRPARLAFWGQAELVAMATDLAEVLGGALALQILFGLPLLLGGVIVGAVSMIMLELQARRGARAFESVIAALLAVIVVGFLAGLFVSDVPWGSAAGGLLPRFEGADSVLVAAAMLGATVMPHAIYVHSALARDRHGLTAAADLPHLLHATRVDVAGSMAVAGTVNIGMLVLAGSTLFGVAGTDTIEGAHAAVASTLGPGVALVFGVGLLASGLASTSVGSYAGATIMGGLLHTRIPLLARRLFTLVPALIILAIGVEPTWALVLSQVVLSIGIPFALIPLARLTSDRAVMGEFANGVGLQVLVWTVVAAIVGLNIALVGTVLT